MPASEALHETVAVFTWCGHGYLIPVPRHSQGRTRSLSMSYVTTLLVFLGILEKENWDNKNDHVQGWHLIASNVQSHWFQNNVCHICMVFCI